MDKFTKLTGVAAPLPMVNVDTDKIIPKQFLKTLKRTGLGKHLFEEMRYTKDGKELPDFVLNQKAWRNAKILVAGAEFRLRQLARARPLGLARLRYPLRDRANPSPTSSTTTASRTASCRSCCPRPKWPSCSTMPNAAPTPR